MKIISIMLLTFMICTSASIAQFSDLGADLLKPLPVDPAVTNLPSLNSAGPINELPSLLSNRKATN
jgi:hypothetical protein